MTRVEPAAGDLGAESLQRTVRVARCYYELGMTQQQIATALDMPRTNVIKRLAQARRSGIVTIRIETPLLENLELADALKARHALDDVEVCLSQADDERTLAEQLAIAAGPAIARRLRDGQTIGLGWGLTLKALADRFQPLALKHASVVSLLPSLTRRSSVTRFEATALLATRLDAEGLYLPAPLLCDSKASRDLLVEQPMFKTIRRRALEADIAVVSIGGLDSATIRQVGAIEDRDFESVRDAGAIGNFLGYYIDRAGESVDHPVNRRIIGITGPVFSTIPERIMVSAGPSKVDALNAVLARGFLTRLITDQATARALLALPDPTPPPTGYATRP